MQKFLEQCYVQELIKFDPTKETANFSEIVIVAIASVMLNNMIYNVGMKYFMTHEKAKELDTEYETENQNIAEKEINPLMFGISEILNSGFYAPFVEELFFRFFLLKVILVKMFELDIHKANIIHAVLFGALHMTNVVVSEQQINRTIMQSIMAGFGGLINGYTYIYTNSIFTPLLAHIINNVLASGSQIIDYASTYNKIVESFRIHFDSV
jgi:hypothetical protein